MSGIFTPPTIPQGSDDPFFGRYKIPVGVSVLRLPDGGFGIGPFGDSPFATSGFGRKQYPTLMELDGLTEGEDWFQGGRSYTVSDEIAALLVASGFEVVPEEGI